MTQIKSEQLPVAYLRLLEEMYYAGELVPCPAWNTSCIELTGVTMECDCGKHRALIPTPGIHTPESLKRYIDEMLDGTLDWAVHEGKEPYTYHDRLRDQWREALDILREDPSSRRAVMTVRLPGDITMTDQPCLTMIQLLIRKGKLDMIVYFRSNDLYEATYMNAYALMELQMRWAKELGVEPGKYTHMVGSLHVYKKNWNELWRVGEAMSAGKMGEMLTPAEEFWEAL